MSRTAWPLVIGIATAATIVVGVSAQSSSAQPRDAVVAPLLDLQKIHRLPTLLVERIRIADLAVRLVRPDAPDYVRHVVHAQLIAPPFTPGPRRFLPPFPPFRPRPRQACAVDTIYSHGAFPTVIHASLADADAAGCEGTSLPDGPVTPTTHPFFQPLGTNGRSCATCHQPPSGMSVSRDNIVARLQATSGTDPLFAGVDGANCPSSLPGFTGTGAAFKAAHSLLLQRGLFRVFESLPPGAQFTVTAAGHDPNGCNTVPPFNEDSINGQTVQMVSVYRRPRISANLNFVTTVISPPGSVGIMWDTREDTLAHQAVDATHGHAQGTVPPTAAQAAAMVQFESRIYTAQSRDRYALGLNAGGAKGGAVIFAAVTPSTAPATTPQISFNEYDAWSGQSGSAVAARRASIARGQALFNTKQFTIANVAGLNDVIPGPFTGTCSGCHSQVHAGNNQFGGAGAVDIGVGGGSVAHNGPAPSADLPIFTIACTAGTSTPFNGSTVVANDLGVALFTGKCADIGKFTIPQLRGVGSHAPFFHDGSASTLWSVVDFYNKRFSIGLTYAQKQDLTNFLAAL